MSDSYYQFSVTADGLSKEEAKWLGKVLRAKANSPLLVGELELDYDKDADNWDPFPLFEYSFAPDGTAIHFVADEHGSLVQVAHIVHMMMKKFNHPGFYKFTAAATCSKMETDQFGGDTVWVTKYGCLWSQEVESLIDGAFEAGTNQIMTALENEKIQLHFRWNGKKK